MPVEIMPPMYSMLQEETQKAIKQARKSDKRERIKMLIYIVYRMSLMYLNGTCLSQKHIEKSHPV
jgi:hypothetical protein